MVAVPVETVTIAATLHRPLLADQRGGMSFAGRSTGPDRGFTGLGPSSSAPHTV